MTKYTLIFIISLTILISGILILDTTETIRFTEAVTVKNVDAGQTELSATEPASTKEGEPISTFSTDALNKASVTIRDTVPVSTVNTAESTDVSAEAAMQPEPSKIRDTETKKHVVKDTIEDDSNGNPSENPTDSPVISNTPLSDTYPNKPSSSENKDKPSTPEKATQTTAPTTEAVTATKKTGNSTESPTVEPPAGKPREKDTESGSGNETGTSTEKASEKATEEDTERTTEKTTEVPKCKHSWVWKTHTETKTIPEKSHEVPVYDDGWDEAVTVQKVYCSECEKTYNTSEDYYAKDHCHGSSGLITVIDHYIHHEPEILYYDTIVDEPAHEETVTVKDYEYCSKCGDRK